MKKDEDMLMALRWKYVMAFMAYFSIYNLYNFYNLYRVWLKWKDNFN